MKEQRADGWYFVKLSNFPCPIWQPAKWNGVAFWIGDKAYRLDGKTTGSTAGIRVTQVCETRIPTPDERVGACS